MNLSAIFHGLLDELDGALSNLRKEAASNFAPVDAVVGKLRQHADTVAATIEQKAIADAEQLGEEALTEATSDATEALPAVEQAVEQTAADVASPAPTATDPADTTPATDAPASA